MIHVITPNEYEIFKHNIEFFTRYGIKSLIIYAFILIIKLLFTKKMSYMQKKTWFISSIIIVILTLIVPCILSLLFWVIR